MKMMTKGKLAKERTNSGGKCISGFNCSKANGKMINEKAIHVFSSVITNEKPNPGMENT